MGIVYHASVFLGQMIEPFERNAPVNPKRPVIGIWVDTIHSDEPDERWELLAADPNADKVEGIVCGAPAAAEWLADRAALFPALRGLFIGDLTREECEISWIGHGDVSRIFRAFPKLEVVQIRGSSPLFFGTERFSHDHLRGLVIESGGLPARVVAEILTAALPNLETLELWLGAVRYGWDGTLDEFVGLFETCPFPKLRHLGLRNAEIADEIAIAIADAPIMDQLTSLDLSLGVLSDHGASALLASTKIKNLTRLDYHHHYVSAEMMAKLRALGIPEINDTEALYLNNTDDEDERYAAVTE